MDAAGPFLHISTPLLLSTPLSQGEGEVWLKLEAVQPTGSFKLRGIGHLCAVRAAAGCRRFVASSGGNAGLAVAHAGRRLGCAVTVFVPASTSAFMRRKIEAEGARVMVAGRGWDEAHEQALKSAAEADTAYIHPFDDPLVWHGHSTLVDEVAAGGLRPDAVVLSVGGGGLLCGVLEGMHRHGWTEVPLFAVETAGAASFHASLRAGRLVSLDAIRSVAVTLGARQVARRAFEWTGAHPIVSLLCSDEEALRACAAFADDHRLLVEPACGAALAPVYGRAPELAGRRRVLVVVCGGAGVGRADFCP